MDNIAFVQKVKMLCLKKDLKPSDVCTECGLGSSFLPDIKRGRVPSVDKVERLAAYLGVTTSELLGEDSPAPVAEAAPAGLSELGRIYRSLNHEGREKLLGYAKDLEDTGRYIKTGLDRLGKAEIV